MGCFNSCWSVPHGLQPTCIPCLSDNSCCSFKHTFDIGRWEDWLFCQVIVVLCVRDCGLMYCLKICRTCPLNCSTLDFFVSLPLCLNLFHLDPSVCECKLCCNQQGDHDHRRVSSQWLSTPYKRWFQIVRSILSSIKCLEMKCGYSLPVLS